MKNNTNKLVMIGIIMLMLFYSLNPTLAQSEIPEAINDQISFQDLSLDNSFAPQNTDDVLFEDTLFHRTDTAEFVPDNLLIKFKTGIDISTPEKITTAVTTITNGATYFAPVISVQPLLHTPMLLYESENKKSFGLDRWVKITLEPDTNVLFEVEKYKNHHYVEYAQPDYIVSSYLTPDDPYYHSYGNWGQDYKDLYGMHIIDAAGAWEYTTGSRDIVVAVVDSGVDYYHEDIIDNLWINEDETPDNGEDDDNDGFIDNIYGADFIYDDGDPLDRYGHGTHCAGTIAAVGNNSLGVVGVNWQTRIMAVQGLDDDGYGSIYAMANGICWAADQGAHVLSNSWGYHLRVPSDPVIEDAVRYAYNKGCVIVFAAGNNNDDVQFYSPQNMDETITVAATDYNDEKAGFSCWGWKVDVSAPGVDILSLRANGTGKEERVVGEYYYRGTGTSMSCPHVSGLAALMLAKNQSLNPDLVKNMIRNTVDPVESNVYVGTGRINASEALRREPAMAVVQPIPDWANVTSIINITGTAWGELFEYYIVEYGRGRSPDSWTEITNSSSQVEDDLLASWDTTGLEDGVYAVRLRVVCSDGVSQDTIWAVVNYEHTVLVVDDDGGPGVDYTRIQAAVDDAGPGDSVYVHQGIYYENILIDRSIDITGENREVTIINANHTAPVVQIFADQVGISGFTVYHNISRYHGIAVHSDHNIITGNIIRNCSYGILIEAASNNMVSENTIMNNSDGICLSASCNNNVITRNTIIDHRSKYSWGIFIACFFSYSICNNNSIIDNIIANSGDAGIYVAVGFGGTNNDTVISENTFTNNVDKGIMLISGAGSNNANTVISNNTITNSNQGIYVYVVASSTNTNNIISQNAITNNNDGIHILTRSQPMSHDAIISGNSVVKNHRYGIYLDDSTSNPNLIYHNNLIHNTQNAFDNSASTWHNGYPSGGNYWSDYTGEDDDGDGIGDIPYEIPEAGNQDLYPLMIPWTTDLPVPPIVYVDDDFNETTPRWQYDHFNTIQDGIDTVSENGIAFVYNGTYTKEIIIDKPLNLIGENKTATAIENAISTDKSIHIQDTDFVTVAGFLIRGTTYGIYINASSEIIIAHNIIADNQGSILSPTGEGTGVYLRETEHPIITYNDICNNVWGIRVTNFSINTVISHNDIYDNKILLAEPEFESLPSSESSKLLPKSLGMKQLNLSLCDEYQQIQPWFGGGIVLDNTTSMCSILENNLSNNYYGVEIASESILNHIYHNYLNNLINAYDEGSNNTWDDGYPPGGNYWHDYDGIDAEGDGIGDIPYIILPYGRNIDRYPLMNPWDGTSPVPEDIIWVDDDYNETTHGWNFNHFDRIQDGINTSVKQGTIYVYEGIYYENILIDKTVNLTGDNRDATIIDGNGTEDVVHITSNWVNLSGFTIQHGNRGIYLDLDVYNNNITGNTIKDNDVVGIYLETSFNNTIINNWIANYSFSGIVFYNSTGNAISDNTISNNYLGYDQYGYGIYISCSYDNIIHENTITGTILGITTHLSDNNQIYHNNFIDNYQHAYDPCSNIWDNGYPSGGNYWDDFDEPGEGAYDSYHGPNQNLNGSDGIVDQGPPDGGLNPYNISGGSNQDMYPLTKPWLYVPGDCDGDHDVDQSDLGILLAAWDSYPGDDNWDERADFNGDGHVYHSDLGILLANWGYGT